jgi:hypothetical protein
MPTVRDVGSVGDSKMLGCGECNRTGEQRNPCRIKRRAEGTEKDPRARFGEWKTESGKRNLEQARRANQQAGNNVLFVLMSRRNKQMFTLYPTTSQCGCRIPGQCRFEKLHDCWNSPRISRWQRPGKTGLLQLRASQMLGAKRMRAQ